MRGPGVVDLSTIGSASLFEAGVWGGPRRTVRADTGETDIITIIIMILITSASHRRSTVARPGGERMTS